MKITYSDVAAFLLTLSPVEGNTVIGILIDTD